MCEKIVLINFLQEIVGLNTYFTWPVLFFRKGKEKMGYEDHKNG